MATLKYIVYKGSIAVDGISLTVFYVDKTVFKVSIIPHTISVTTLLNKKVGSKVNLECDMIGKYVEKLLSPNNKDNNSRNNISIDFLNHNGFM